MKSSTTTNSLKCLFASLLISAMAVPAYAGPAQDSWGEVFGIAQSGSLVGASTGSDGSGLVIGDADVNLEEGIVRFEVKGLAVPTVDTTPMVKGVVVCRVSAGERATLVETPAIPIDSQGSARFAGPVVLPPACHQNSHDMGFMVRAVQGTPPSADSWD